VATLTLLATAAGSNGTSADPPKDWWAVLILIGVGGALVLGLLFWFYKELQKSDFIQLLLGLPTKENLSRETPAKGAFHFAEEFLARRTEFWLLYAQVFVAIFFIAAITALLLVKVVSVQAGLPALSTVVGIVLGKTLLSAKGTPLATQEGASGLTPSNVKPPSITVSPEPVAVGSVLTADPGDWSGPLPMSYAYSWRRKDAKGQAPIPDQSESAYTVTEDDKGKSIAVTVSASSGGRSASAISAPIAIPEAPVQASTTESESTE
jgi:hypothetical protein